VRPNRTGSLLVASFVALGAGWAQAQTAGPAEAKTGPAEVAKHWSKYTYPESVPEGVAYHIIVKGDTLWDLAGHYLNNPLLWPQIWEENKYITDAHWIYPGDPLILRKIEMVAEQAGVTPPTPEAEAAAGAEAGQGAAGAGAGETAPQLYPATEQVTIQCAPYLTTENEDRSFHITGSEQGKDKIAYADRDIVYLNRGTSSGVKAGDVFNALRLVGKIKHPVTGKMLGTKVAVAGWLRVILAGEKTSTAVVEQACLEITDGDYLKPFEKLSVPLVMSANPPDRTEPPSGKTRGYIVDLGSETSLAAAAGHLVTIDKGSADGIAPGNALSVFRMEVESAPTRHVLGTLAILTVREHSAVGKVMTSTTAIVPGDEVEVR